MMSNCQHLTDQYSAVLVHLELPRVTILSPALLARVASGPTVVLFINALQRGSKLIAALVFLVMVVMMQYQRGHIHPNQMLLFRSQCLVIVMVMPVCGVEFAMKDNAAMLASIPLLTGRRVTVASAAPPARRCTSTDAGPPHRRNIMVVRPFMHICGVDFPGRCAGRHLAF